MKGIYVNALCLKHPREVFRAIYHQIFGEGGSIEPYTAMYKLSTISLSQISYFKKELTFSLMLSTIDIRRSSGIQGFRTRNKSRIF